MIFLLEKKCYDIVFRHEKVCFKPFSCLCNLYKKSFFLTNTKKNDKTATQKFPEGGFILIIRELLFYKTII